MVIIGYQQASGINANGRRVFGYRLYVLDRVDGVTGFMPTSVFVPGDALTSLGLTPQSLLDKNADIKKDPYGRLCKLTVSSHNR